MTTRQLKDEVKRASLGVNHRRFTRDRSIEWLPNFFGTYTYLTTEIHDGILSRSAINDSIVPDVSGNQLPYAPNHNLILGLTYNIKKAVEIMFNYK